MSAPLVVAGVDGGASSTTCVLADSTGRVLGVGRGGPVDHLYRPAGRRQTRDSLREAFASAARVARLRRPVRAVVAGLTGLEPESPEARTAVRMISGLIRADLVQATWDAEIAFHGAAAGGPGVMVIAGTGSVALGRNAAGRTARAGGYGFLIDDAGGGVSIGQAALRAALRSLDGRGPPTRLQRLISAKLGSWPAIRKRVYGSDGGRPLLASLVPLVAAAARQGDDVARDILREAGRSLAHLAVAVAARLGMVEEVLDLFPVGGVLAAGRDVRDSLREEVLMRAPRCRIRRPRLPPAIGAVLMAFEAAGIQPDAGALRRLRGNGLRLT